MDGGTKVTQDFLVLDGVYYWHYESVGINQQGARYRLITQRAEGKDLVLLTRPMESCWEYHLYIRDPNGNGPEEE